MYAAVVKLNTLTDTVRTAAKNHDLLVVAARTLILDMVAGEVVCGIRCATYVYALPAFYDTLFGSCIADLFLSNA